MSELRSVIETLRTDVVSQLPDARVEQDFAELQAACEALEAERLRRLAEIARRRLFESDGHLSAASWLVARFCVAWGEARRAVVTARALERMPIVRRGFDTGAVSLSAVRTLVEAHEAEPEAFEASERFLVEAAVRNSVPDLRRVVAHWRHVVERERAGSAFLDSALRRRRRLHASVTLEGMVRLDGDLDPESGETFMTALRAVLDAQARSELPGDDERSPAQRRADALGEICRGWLEHADRPEVAGERPHLSVTVPLETLALAGANGPESLVTGSHATSTLDHVGPIDSATVRRLACDASVTRIVLGPRSEPLDVGRKTSVVPPAIRRAVVARDRRCRFPGCDRPHSWCDAHHVVHWADGGGTSVANLVLLCRRHHRLTHERFSVEVVDGRPVFRRPDGSVLDEHPDRAPP
ncbi:HNH endonuclease signature motif containing protein [soil metagenome]